MSAINAINRRALKPGLLFDHLGTVYRVLSVKDDRVRVINPATGYKGWIPWKIIRLRGRKIITPKQEA